MAPPQIHGSFIRGLQAWGRGQDGLGRKISVVTVIAGAMLAKGDTAFHP